MRQRSWYSLPNTPCLPWRNVAAPHRYRAAATPTLAVWDAAKVDTRHSVAIPLQDVYLLTSDGYRLRSGPDRMRRV